MTLSSKSTSLDGRIVLVTGATRGIGRAVALALAKVGALVVATGRTAGALEELDDAIKATPGAKSAVLIKLDLAKGDLVDGLGPSLYERFGKLDGLIANAGILGTLGPLGHQSPQDMQTILDVNLLSNWRLIRTLDPLLKRSDAGRVVFVTSGAASGKNAYWGPYAVSKAALDALARTYAAETQSTPIRVNLVSPGPIATRMRAKAFPGEDPATLVTAEAIAPLFLELVAPSFGETGKTFDAQAFAKGKGRVEKA
jgi:NAD(P)-dependent dehydrogenase (short-subunit alcohol dehydrogenase family)